MTIPPDHETESEGHHPSVRQAMELDYEPITDLKAGRSSLTPAIVVGVALCLALLGYWWVDDSRPGKFFDNEVNVLVAFALGVSIFGVVVYIFRAIWQSHKQADIVSTESCLLCDSTQVEPYSGATGDSEYRCGNCGYDSDLANQPQTSRLVTRYQDVKNALYALHSADKAMSKAAAFSNFGGDQEHGYMAEASRQMREAHALLGAIADEFPQVLHVPATGSDYSAASSMTALSAIFGENVFSAAARHKRERQAIAKEAADVSVYLSAIEQIAAWMRHQILSGNTSAQ